MKMEEAPPQPNVHIATQQLLLLRLWWNVGLWDMHTPMCYLRERRDQADMEQDEVLLFIVSFLT